MTGDGTRGGGDYPVLRGKAADPPGFRRQNPLKLLMVSQMDEALARRWRGRIGKIGALICTVFLLAVLDGLVGRFRDPSHEYSVLSGESLRLTGPLREDVPDIGGLAYESGTEGIRLTFEAIQPSFWYGNALWRGVLEVDSGVSPGAYTLRVVARGNPAVVLSPILRVVVHADGSSYRLHSKSLFLRYLNISPWWVAVFALPLVCSFFCAILMLSRRVDRFLAREGKAEIYRVLGDPPQFEIAFGLGTAHGVSRGMELSVLDPRGIPIGRVQVREVSLNDAVGTVSTMAKVKPGFLVHVSQGAPKRSEHDPGHQGLIR